MTDSFGIRLRRARERREISLADIAARTKIKASLFEEIERDDASHWPSGIYRRSFIREYAHAVGLNPDDTVREFVRRFPDPEDTSAEGAGRGVAAGSVRPEPPPASEVPAAGASPARQPATAAAGLRLTLVETGMPFRGGRVLADMRRRWYAAAWDGGSLLAIALTAFVLTGSFWMPFAVAAACYYVGGVLVLGNSPGVCLFAPRPKVSGTSGSTPVRSPRPRHVEPVAARHTEPAFRARRWAAKRSELST